MNTSDNLQETQKTTVEQDVNRPLEAAAPLRLSLPLPLLLLLFHRGNPLRLRSQKPTNQRCQGSP